MDKAVTPSITVSFDYNFWEYMDACRVHFANKGGNKKYVLAAGGVLLLGVILCVAFGYSWYRAIFIYAGILMEISLLLKFFLSAKRYFESNPRAKETHTLTFFDERILFKLQTMTIELKWTQYSSFREDPKFYLLYYGPESFLIIPKRAFNAQDLPRFDQLLKSKIIEKQEDD